MLSQGLPPNARKPSLRFRAVTETPIVISLTKMSGPREWTTTEHVLEYFARADGIPHRAEGESVLLEFVPKEVRRILDLGTGDGRLLALLRIDRRDAQGIALDFSPTMLAAARKRFRDDGNVQVIEHDMEDPLPDMGRFDAIASSFAIHHCTDERKRALYTEIPSALLPFCPSARWHLL